MKILQREGTSNAGLMESPSRDHSRREAVDTGEVLASTILFMVGLQPVMNLQTVSQIALAWYLSVTAQGSPFVCKPLKQT